MDGPSAQGFLSLTGPLAPRVVDCPAGNAYKVSVTGFTFSIIWQNKHYDDQPPPVAFSPPLVPYGTTFPPQAGAQQPVLKLEQLMRCQTRGTLLSHHEAEVAKELDS